jgi:hypothetical protein
VWNGTGDLVLLPRGTRRSLAWHIDAWPLLAGELRGTMALDSNAAQPAAFAYSHGRAELRGVDADLPMETLLQSAGVPAALSGAGGSLVAHIEQFIRTPDAVDADLVLQWQDASLPAPVPGVRIALGDIRLDLRGSGSEVGGPVSNRGGDVDVAGRATLSAAAAATFDAILRLRPGIDRDRADAITTALSLIGTPDGQGGFRIAWPR